MFYRLLDQIGDLAVFAVVSFIFGVMKCLTLPEPQNWKQSILSVMIAVSVGTLAGAVALEVSFGDYTALTISSVASLMSRDIFMAIINNRGHISELVKRASNNIVDKFTK